MQAFKNVTVTKKEFLAEIKKHAKLDNFIRGDYNGPGDKGCAVGCSLKTVNKLKGTKITPSNHSAYEEHLGIPTWLARVEDRIFENVSKDRSKTWPVEFIAAINPGSNLNKIKGPFLIMVLKSALKNFDHKKYPDVKAAIDGVIKLYKNGETDPAKFQEARAQARAAAAAAYAAAAAATYAAATYAAAADAAAYAAAATYAAAADAAAATYAAAADAAAYAAAAATYAAARVKKWEYFADELLKLIKGCKK